MDNIKITVDGRELTGFSSTDPVVVPSATLVDGFLKFPSLVNHYKTNEIDRILQNNPELYKERFLVTEKLDGANFQIHIHRDGTVRCGKRTTMLKDNESFYDWQTTVAQYQDKIDAIVSYINHQAFCTSIRLFGELFGEGINSRVKYCKGKQIRIFRVMFDDVDHGVINGLLLFQLTDILDWWVPVVSPAVTLEAALEFDVNKETYIPNTDGLEGNRNMEGVVITPLNLPSVLAIKKKSEDFEDKQRVPKEVVPDTPEFERMSGVFSSYFCSNRLLDLFSKEGQIKEDSEIGKYIKLMRDDVMLDFMSDHKEEFLGLSDSERKRLIGLSGKLTLNLLKEYL